MKKLFIAAQAIVAYPIVVIGYVLFAPFEAYIDIRNAIVKLNKHNARVRAMRAQRLHKAIDELKREFDVCNCEECGSYDDCTLSIKREKESKEKGSFSQTMPDLNTERGDAISYQFHKEKDEELKKAAKADLSSASAT